MTIYENIFHFPSWLDWQLKGVTESKTVFIDGDLKDYQDWTIQHKNF
jgi:hypothetical protein